MQNKQEAEELKKKGNEFYKQLKLEEALKMFQKASELDPENPIYFSNQAAVFFEFGDYENCVKVSEKSINLQPSEDIQFKVLSRICRSFYCLQKFEETLETIKKIKAIKVTKEFDSYESYASEKLQEKHEENSSIKNVLNLNRNRLVESLDYIPVSREQPNSLLQSIHSAKEPNRILLENLLKNEQVKEFNFLYDHSGDVRNILETFLDLKIQLEKLKEEDTKEFKNINIYMKDQDARILARNILVLFLCSEASLEEKNPNFIQGFNFIYNIWISINLIPSYHSNLIKILKILIDFGSDLKSWSSNPKTNFIFFESEDELQNIVEIWEEWVEDERSLPQILKNIKKIEDHPNFNKEMKQKFVESKMKTIPKGEAFQQEMEFYLTNYLILPLPNLEHSNPNDYQKWKSNPTLNLKPNPFESLTVPVKLKEIKQISLEPDCLIKSGSPIYQQVPSFAMGSSLCLMMYSQSLQFLKSKKNLKIFVTSSEEQQNQKTQNVIFDRIHSTNLVESSHLLNLILTYGFELKENEYSNFQTDFQTYYKYYKDKNHLILSLLKMESENELKSILGLSMEGEVNTYLRWFFKKPMKSELVPKRKLQSWLYSIFLLITHPMIRNPTAIIVEQPSLTLFSFVKLSQYLIEKVGYPIHYITEIFETILSGNINTNAKLPENSPEKFNNNRENKKIMEFDTRNYNFEISLLLNFVQFSNSIQCSKLKNLNCYFGYFQIRPAVFQVHNYQHSLGILMLRNCDKFSSKKFIEIEGNLFKKIESMGNNCQILSNFKYFDCNKFEIILPESEFQHQDTEFILFRIDLQLIISQPTKISILKKI
eukprot:gene8107-12568_t